MGARGGKMDDVDVRYELRFWSATGAYLGVSDDLISYEDARRENYVTDMVAEFPPDFFDGVRSSWREPLVRIGVYRSVNGRPFELDGNTFWLVVAGQRTVSGGERRYRLTTHCANWVLGDGQRGRIVDYAAGTAQASKSGEVDAIAKAVIRENMGASATDPARDLSEWLGVAADIVGVTPATEYAFAYKQVRRVLDTLSGVAADAGVVWLYDVVPGGDPGGRPMFVTYIGQAGVVRPIIFGEAFGNVSELSVGFDYRSMENALIVGGQGSGAARLVARGAADSAGLSPFSRRERFRSESSLSTMASLQAARDAYLLAGRPVSFVEMKVQQVPGAIYGIDWSFGDVVQWQDGDQSGSARVAVVGKRFNNRSKTEDITAYLSTEIPVGGTYGVDEADITQG